MATKKMQREGGRTLVIMSKSANLTRPGEPDESDESPIVADSNGRAAGGEIRGRLPAALMINDYRCGARMIECRLVT